MKIWRTYSTNITYTHTIPERPEVVDTACLSPHTHENVGVRVEILQEGWIDYKYIKKNVENILEKFQGNIGEADTESMVQGVLKELKSVFTDAHGFRVEIQETPKYGVLMEAID